MQTPSARALTMQLAFTTSSTLKRTLQLVDISLNYFPIRLAVDLIEESRDMWGLQPDAYMYERLLLGALRNGYCRDTAKYGFTSYTPRVALI